MSLPPCIILCGGAGSRLGEISKTLPKCLLPIKKNKPFLYFQLKYLESAGIEKVVLCIGHMGEMIRHFLESFETNMKIEISDDGRKPLGTGGAVKKAIQNLNCSAFVTYGDTFLDISYKKIFDEFLIDKSPLMVIYKNDSKYDKSNVLLKNKKIFYNKHNPHPMSQYIDYGLSIFNLENFINSTDSFDLSQVQESLSEKGQLSYYVAKKRFYEIGTPQSLNETRNYLLNYDIERL